MFVLYCTAIVYRCIGNEGRSCIVLRPRIVRLMNCAWLYYRGPSTHGVAYLSTNMHIRTCVVRMYAMLLSTARPDGAIRMYVSKVNTSYIYIYIYIIYIFYTHTHIFVICNIYIYIYIYISGSRMYVSEVKKRANCPLCHSKLEAGHRWGAAANFIRAGLGARQSPDSWLILAASAPWQLKALRDSGLFSRTEHRKLTCRWTWPWSVVGEPGHKLYGVALSGAARGGMQLLVVSSRAKTQRASRERALEATLVRIQGGEIRGLPFVWGKSTARDQESRICIRLSPQISHVFLRVLGVWDTDWCLKEAPPRQASGVAGADGNPAKSPPESPRCRCSIGCRMCSEWARISILGCLGFWLDVLNRCSGSWSTLCHCRISGSSAVSSETSLLFFRAERCKLALRSPQVWRWRRACTYCMHVALAACVDAAGPLAILVVYHIMLCYVMLYDIMIF